MDNKNNVNNNTTATTGNAGNTAPAPATTEQDKKLMEMKAAYATFEAEQRKNRTFGEKVIESLPYVVSGLALAGSGVAIGVSIKALNETTKVLNETRAQIGYAPSPDGDLE